MEEGRIWSVGVLEGAEQQNAPSEIERLFYDFLHGFRIEDQWTYRDALRSALLLKHHTLEVDLRDLVAWNEELAQKVQDKPGEMIPLVSLVFSLFLCSFLISHCSLRVFVRVPGTDEV